MWAPSGDNTAAPDFRAVFDAAPRPLLLIAVDAPKYTMLAVNRAHAAAFRTTPGALQGRGVLEVFPKDAGPTVDLFVDAIRQSFEAVLATGKPHQMDVSPYPVTQPDGANIERYWSATNAPVCDDDGRIVQILSAVQDVTGEVLERRSEQARALLMREVDHRARNALTVVQSFVRLTVAPDLESFREILQGRVESLARAQTSLAARKWEGGDLAAIIEAEVQALSPAGRHAFAGPAVTLRPDQVQAMSMAIHELATNACKYGALSTHRGRLDVAWRLTDADTLELSWMEAGGPPVRAPDATGFGSRLVRQLARQLCGEIALEWRAEGLKAILSADLRPQTGADPQGDWDWAKAATSTSA